MNDFSRKQDFLDSAGLISIGLFSLGYVIFARLFAELHIQLFFLDFPIFVGEILLFICLLLFSTKYSVHSRTLAKWHYLIICYFVFVIVKAMYGYFKWGPLALRDAALLYYPAFIVFGYAFYRKEFFDRKRIFLAFLIIFIFIIGRYYEYWTLTLAVLALILLRNYSRKSIQLLMISLLLVFIPYIRLYETSRMMLLSNFVFGMYLTAIAPVFLVNKKRWRFALFMFIGGLVVLGALKFTDKDKVKSIFDVKRMVALFEKYDKDAAAIDRSQIPEPSGVKLYNPDKLIPDHSTEIIFKDKILSNKQMEAEMRHVLIVRAKQKVADFSFEGKIPEEDVVEVKKEIGQVLVKLEDGISARESREVDTQTISNEVSQNTAVSLKNIEVPLISDQASGNRVQEAEPGVRKKVKQEIMRTLAEEINIEMRTAPLEKIIGNDKIPPAMYSEARMLLQSDFQDEIKQKLPAGTSREPFEKKWVENNNAIFRLLIWRDMWLDLKNERPTPIFGLDFGRPFRSKTLEALQWGYGDWIRDGWIGAHNSFLHIIYRTGIIGILLISGLLIMLGKMIRRFIRVKSFTGVLLCGIIINWFVAANFLLIFELPYTAIPIWTIYGMTLAYCSQIQGPRHSIGPT